MAIRNVIFFGMAGAFSHAPLRALLDAGLNVGAVIIPAQGPPPLPAIAPVPAPGLPHIPLIVRPGGAHIVQLARQRGIPVYALDQPGDALTLATLAELQPDLACVACFDRRIPPALLELPRLGFINLHPSLLPAHRGPTPLFWIFREGLGAFGVSIHHMDSGLDTGDLLLQAGLTLPDGISGIDAEQACAELGARLLVRAVKSLSDGTLQGYPQGSNGSYQPRPGASDFVIDPAWPARRAFNFMRGTADWKQPYLLTVAGQHFRLAQAINYEDDGELTATYEFDGNTLRVRCNPGVLYARLAP